MVTLAQVVDINPWAVVAAAVATFALGGAWYMGLFRKPWQKMTLATYKTLTEKDMGKNAGPAYVGSFFAYLVQAYVLAYLAGLLQVASWVEGAVVGAWVALGFVVTQALVHSLYHNTRKHLWAIETGYQVLQLVLMGAIIGAWR